MRKETKSGRGITLIEIMMVIGILSIIATFSLSTNLDDFHRYSFRDDRDLIIGSLQKTRSRAINNICLGVCLDGESHGVHFESGKLIVFQGTNFSTRNTSLDETFPLNPNINLTGVNEVVFSQLSGDATTTPINVWHLHMTNNMQNDSTININDEGQITWTN